MLSISKVGGTGLEYYTTEYYAEGKEDPIKLRGQGAPLLQNSNVVTKEEFSNLLNGFTPDGTTKLVQNAGKPNHQAGLDCTFSPPKPFSVLWALSDEKRHHNLRSIHERANEIAARYLGQVGGFSRTGTGGERLEKAALTSASFTHPSSRASDPQLHTHNVFLNVGFRADGTTGALWTKEIFRHKLAAGQLYRDALAGMIRVELGLEIEPRKVGFHIKGVPEELCGVFSKRRKEIVQELLRVGESSAVAAKLAALNTRPKKQKISLRELKAYWARVGREFGFGPEEAQALLKAGEQAIAVANAEKISAKPVCQPDPKHATPEDTAPKPGAEKLDAPQEQSAGERGDSPSPRKEPEESENRKTRDQKKSSTASHTKRDRAQTQKRPQRLVRWRLLFPHAPEWSPFKTSKSPYLNIKADEGFRRFGKIKWKKGLAVAELRIQQKYLFPRAPITPLRRLAIPALRVLSPSQVRNMKAKADHFRRMEERLSQSR